MAEVSSGQELANGESLRVEDLIFLDDLGALGVPWIDRLIDRCTSHEEVEMLWTLIRMAGPDDEDAHDVLELAAHMPHLEHEGGTILAMIRACENYRS